MKNNRNRNRNQHLQSKVGLHVMFSEKSFVALLYVILALSVAQFKSQDLNYQTTPQEVLKEQQN